jgi:hypothetical protein
MEDLQEYAIERLLAASPVVYDDGGHKSFLSPEKREAIAYYDEAITLSEKFGNQAGREWALACATAEQLEHISSASGELILNELNPVEMHEHMARFGVPKEFTPVFARAFIHGITSAWYRLKPVVLSRLQHDSELS